MSRQDYLRRRRERFARRGTKPCGVRRRAFTLRRKLESYSKALRRWHEAGRPERSDAEVAELFDACCTPCEEFDAAGNSCRICGCKVRRGGLVVLGSVEIRSGFVNKLKMATEHCPLEKW